MRDGTANPTFLTQSWEFLWDLRAAIRKAGTAPFVEKLMTLSELEAFFQISRSTLYRMRKEGDFPPGIRIRGHWRWMPNDIRIFLQRHRATTSRESCLISPEFSGAIARGPRRLRAA